MTHETHDRALQLARESIHAGISYLAGAQVHDGSFPGKSSSDKHDFEGAVATRTTFNTSMVARILGSMRTADQRVLKMCTAASRFLFSQKSNSGSWNYWCAGAARSNLPDDLDDTFCALAAVQLANPEAITPDVLNQVVRILTTAEDKPGGPYRTWIVHSDAAKQWRDVDLAVNCNVAYFLQLQGIRVHALEAYISDRVEAGDFTSAYYPDSLTVLYLLSRLTFVHKDLLRVGEISDAASAALALSISPDSPQAAAWASLVLDSAHTNGSWPAFGFCLDPVVEGDQHYAGSRSLSTALCASALEAWLTAQDPVQAEPENIHAAYALRKVRSELQLFSAEWRELGSRYLKKLEPLLNEITSIHAGFAKACGLLGTSPPLEQSSPFMLELAYASLCGWMAFTMYDDVVDGDTDPAAVVLANHFFSELHAVYSTEFLNTTRFKKVMLQILRRVTHGGMHELSHCKVSSGRAPHGMNSLRIANRSMGHALSCVAVLFKSLEVGNKRALQPMHSTLRFFSCYLAARQLHDDGHDWKRDYTAGTLNAVGADLLSAHAVLRTTEPLSTAWMEQEFAERGLHRLCAKVCERVADATAIVDAEPSFADKSFFYALVCPLQDSAERTLHGAAQGEEFLQGYLGSLGNV